MKHQKYILPVLGLLILATTLWCIRQPRILPESQCSPAYWHYAQVPGIEASFVKDFPLNDTVSIDVTLLQATTDPAWQRLREDFGINHLTPKMLDNLNKGKVVTRFAPKCNYSMLMDSVCKVNNDLLSFSFTDQIVSVFHVEDTVQFHAVKMWQLNAMINKYPLKKIKNEKKNN